MDSILQSIEDWFRGLLVSGIMDNLSNAQMIVSIPTASFARSITSFAAGIK